MKNNLYIYVLSAYMFLLGSHLLVHYLWIFILPALLLIDWKKKFPIEIYFLLFFLISLYGVYIYGHRGIFHDSKWATGVIVEITMIFLVYLLGISPKNIDKLNMLNDKKIFYLLYGFFIAYGIGIVYSYYFLPQNNPLNSSGFRVFYQSLALYTHKDGQIPVTHVAYFQSFLIILIPYLILDFKKFKKLNFNYSELIFLLLLGIFSLYIALGTGRRLALLLFILFSIYFVSYTIYSTSKRYNIYYSLSILVIIAIVITIISYFIQDSYTMSRVRSIHGLSDDRYKYWLIGLEYIWQYPGGGADRLPALGANPRVHNTWIDIGKSFGIMAFIASILFYMIHIKYFIRIIFNKNISLFIKNIIIIISFLLFVNMLVEPVFHTEKSLFFYSIFFLGFLKFYSDTYSDIEKSATLS